MTLEKQFLEKRIAEQKEYIASLESMDAGLRAAEVTGSARRQLDYLEGKLDEFEPKMYTKREAGIKCVKAMLDYSDYRMKILSGDYHGNFDEQEWIRRNL